MKLCVERMVYDMGDARCLVWCQKIKAATEAWAGAHADWLLPSGNYLRVFPLFYMKKHHDEIDLGRVHYSLMKEMSRLRSLALPFFKHAARIVSKRRFSNEKT